MLKYVGLTLMMLMLASQHAAAESNQKLAEILADNPSVEINKLTENMVGVIPDLPTSFSQTSWNAGIDSGAWDETRVALLVSQVADAEQTLEKVETYKQQYAYVFKHRNDDVDNAKAWLMRVGGAIFQMKKQAKMFEQRMRHLKKILPQVIKTTALKYEQVTNAEKQKLKLRLQAQYLCYQAIKFPTDAEIQAIQSEYSL